ncbi:Metalloenzyme, LuxS/M16 peptidase-like protein [Flagelloscypha sp. PMI_526]|nr:Metalloenzyme, LuxS/M16 peptidase-like protein [Flagelloscypha sp. PMI_526]
MKRRAGFVLRQTGHRSLHSSAPTTIPPQITTFPNKVRVATSNTPGHFSTVGVYIDGGSRYEGPRNLGVSHFLDRLAYKSTTTKTEEQVASALHSLGGQALASSSRETIMYQSSQFQQATPTAMELIADTILHPRFTPDELAWQVEAARYELREMFKKPEMFLPEFFHALAYGNSGLGNPVYCSEDRLDQINSALLRESMKEWYRPERIVVAGAGIPHEQLVEMSEKYFAHLQPDPPSPASHSKSQSPFRNQSRAASHLSSNPLTWSPGHKGLYKGGHQFILDRESEFNHVYIGFEGPGVLDEDIYTLATMHVILGGGGSFSAGGPGKGMYSRLYTHILNLFSQVDHCAAFHHIYSDSCLFGLFASFVPASSGLRGGNTPSQILPHIVHQLSLLLYTDINEQELSRAKNQLKSMLAMTLESQSVEVEDLGRQLLVHRNHIPVHEMLAKVDKITPGDINRVAQRVYHPSSGNVPTILCMGHDELGDWQSVFKKYGVGTIH